MKNISIVGIGMGNIDTITIKALEKIKTAEVLIGAERMIESLKVLWDADKWEKIKKDFSIAPLKILDAIENLGLEDDNIVILMSGDTGFFSGTKKLSKELKERNINCEILPGISSLSYLSSKVGESWGELKIVSLHGRKGNPAGYVMKNDGVFFLLDKKNTPAAVCECLVGAGLGDSQVIIGERLSYEDEKISNGKARDFVESEFDSLSVMIVKRPGELNSQSYTLGISDDDFIRGKVPMTKEEVRTISISKLGIKPSDIIYDVGAGTGSVAIEMALQAPYGKVYAIETKPEAVDLIKVNKEKFYAHNLEVISGLAPEAFSELPAPDKVFIGGSKGNMKEIILQILDKNPDVKFVINAIALETLSEVIAIFKELEFSKTDIIQMAVTRTKKVASYTMLDAINPIFIAVAEK